MAETRHSKPAQAKESLSELLEEIRACRFCVETPIGAALPHEPRPVLQVSSTARLAIFGQAPGARVHKSGRPFTDPSGDRLRDWLGIGPDIFYDETRVAIAPMGFCFPGYDDKGADRPPRKECAPLWRARLIAAMPRVETAVLVGSYAQNWHLEGPTLKTMTETVANWRAYAPAFFVIPHPSWRNNAWIRKHPWFEGELLPALRAAVGAATAPLNS
ncbi:MAG: uracil-DNA glycosylase family protein [Parvularculaceae bacterium]|nr:uracil-DNA glycosylase family protein [Parvularculaceae bacterium]